MDHPRRLAQEGVARIEQAILELLSSAPCGLGNADITKRLGLESDQKGTQRNYLSWSVLGRMMKAGTVVQVAAPEGRRLLYKLPADNT